MWDKCTCPARNLAIIPGSSIPSLTFHIQVTSKSIQFCTYKSFSIPLFLPCYCHCPSSGLNNYFSWLNSFIRSLSLAFFPSNMFSMMQSIGISNLIMPWMLCIKIFQCPPLTSWLTSSVLRVVFVALSIMIPPCFITIFTSFWFYFPRVVNSFKTEFALSFNTETLYIVISFLH